MNKSQRSQCQSVIHTAAAASGAGNLLPVPGAGLLADWVAMTLMTTRLAAIFGGSLTGEAAKGWVVVALKEQLLRSPIRTVTRELFRPIPLLGMLVAPAVSVSMIEATGWLLAERLDRTFADLASMENVGSALG